MLVSKEKIDNYVLEYFTYIIESTKKRKELVDKTRFIVARNIEEFGFPSLTRLHETLDEILDRHKQKRTISLDEDLTGDGFNLHKVIPSNEGFAQPQDLKKGDYLLKSLRNILPEQEFCSLVDLLGGLDNAMLLLSQSRLTPEDILREHNLLNISWLSKLSSESKELQTEYRLFQRGHRRGNPIQALDSTSLPLIQKVISEVYGQGTTMLNRSLSNMGFRGLIRKEGGIARIVEKINPGLLHKISYIHKWNKEQKSVELALSAIKDVLYELPGYKEAEKTNNRDEQVRIVNEFIRKEASLLDYFYKKGLRGLMNGLIDQTSKLGFRKACSPKALFEFYSGRRGLNWFDRTQKTYVQGWRIREIGMWQRGEESAQLGIEAIEDVLYELPGYKEAERTNNRDEQVKIINELVKNVSLFDYFKRKGLCSLMKNLIDSSGKMGLKKMNSPKAVLEFYSGRKGLNWFDQDKLPHVVNEGNRRLKFVYDN